MYLLSEAESRKAFRFLEVKIGYVYKAILILNTLLYFLKLYYGFMYQELVGTRLGKQLRLVFALQNILFIALITYTAVTLLNLLKCKYNYEYHN
mgnify:CR=1 FL=1